MTTRTRPHRTRRALAAVAALPLLALTACGSSDEPAAAPAGGAQSESSGASGGSSSATGANVAVKLLAFSPEQVKVAPGDTVTWELADGIRHVLVQGTFEEGADGLRTSETDDKTFSLELAKKGDKVSHTYAKAGTYTYYCTIHKGMHGSVVVG